METCLSRQCGVKRFTTRFTTHFVLGAAGHEKATAEVLPLRCYRGSKGRDVEGDHGSLSSECSLDHHDSTSADEPGNAGVADVLLWR